MNLELKKFGNVEEEVDLKNYNTYRIGGIAKYLVSPTSFPDLIDLIKYLKENNVEHIFIGNGSNIVLNDAYFEGVVINFKNLSAYEVHNDGTIYAEAGASLPKVALASIDKSLKGLEFAVGIPGTLGGSIVGNAGAYNACLLDYVSEVTILNEQLEIKTLQHEEITYSYRTTMFKEKKNALILSAKIKLTPGDKHASLDIVNDRKRRRLETQPLEYPSAGSVFRNPEGDFAGRLIEVCGLKGYQIGGARVSDKHANFIINYEDATSQDIYKLIHYVHDEVLAKTNVDLKIEQEFIGWK